MRSTTPVPMEVPISAVVLAISTTAECGPSSADSTSPPWSKPAARKPQLEPLLNLAELNRRGQFNEWHHGETGEPLGAQDQAWSAGMYLFACECVTRGQVALP